MSNSITSAGPMARRTCTPQLRRSKATSHEGARSSSTNFGRFGRAMALDDFTLRRLAWACEALRHVLQELEREHLTQPSPQSGEGEDALALPEYPSRGCWRGF